MKRFAGGLESTAEEHAARFLGKHREQSTVEGFFDRKPLTRGRTKRSPKSASPGTGLEWLRAFVTYESDECLIYPFATTASPYGTVSYCGKPMTAHRVMCLLANKRPPEGKPMALHRCGNGHRGCVNPMHLYWGNAADNARDAARHRKDGKPSAADGFGRTLGDPKLDRSAQRKPD